MFHRRKARRLERTLQKAEKIRAELGVEQLEYNAHRAQVDELVTDAIREADEVLGGEGGAERARSVIDTLREAIVIDEESLRVFARALANITNVKAIPDAVERAAWTFLVQAAYRLLKG